MARILVADDEPGLRAFMAEVLARDGHTVVQAADGAEAARHLARAAFDLLVTDLRMPGLDGLALLRQVKAEQPELEVIVLTAYGSVETAVEAMKQGAFDYLQKPIEGPAALRLLATRALERRELLTLKARTVLDAPALPPLSYGDPVMVPVMDALRRVAPTNASVLLLGESGTGKEVAARTIHEWSARAAGPFVAVNCAAIAEHLLESELFGHEKGAFTGAVSAHRGRLELAAGGTFFLDEISEMKPDLQAKLLRVIQERRFERVGGQRTMDADVRWIAATNRDADELLRAGVLREDLYHRLAVFPIRLPPLRERRQDLLPMVGALLARIAHETGRGPLELGDDARRAVLDAPWRGNVRELSNALERATILADGPTISAEHLDLRVGPMPADGPRNGEPRSLRDIEAAAIADALRAAGGNRRDAARRLGIGLRTLYDKLKRNRAD